jgi:hypothetical protein
LGKLIDEFTPMKGKLQVIKHYGRISRLKEHKFKNVLSNWNLRGRCSREDRDKNTNKGFGKKGRREWRSS